MRFNVALRVIAGGNDIDMTRDPGEVKRNESPQQVAAI